MSRGSIQGRMGAGSAGLAGKTVLFSKVLSDSMSPERSEKAGGVYIPGRVNPPYKSWG